ncbi:MAG: hypothetical protein GWN84_26075, partial [Gammaproteobacteria bacterium]|nr:hypothetical protein [Gammaproteobacteria bacterium]NIR82550.1 hypothetical protein [Gammaproteobacteria bacterium]NIU04055.1 hypothetical protein [Gammaproteobacteria bacterium]NIX85329.1 hypothetical protein [Gammaproteobacteria bacterium]
LGVQIKPWRRDGDHLIVATQSETFFRVRLGISRDEWTQDVLSQLRRHTDREIIVCHK